MINLKTACLRSPIFNKKRINYRLIDDLAIGLLISNEFPDVKLHDMIDTFIFVDSTNLDTIDYTKYIYYRNRSEVRYNDVINMEHIISKL